MLIGTAGHIDHGKTTLVRALTGVDTTHLPEERARGITIELGYAFTPLESGDDTAGGQVRSLGFIDVPGHERFIPTMLMGASGIDFALLVVAADDGVMPQTREHLAILHLLGVERGAVALTKCDRVPPARIQEVEAQILALLASTSLADSPVFAVSAVSGAGVEPLRRHLQRLAETEAPRPADSGFRLVVDRRFSLAGAGTIVTGTVLAGAVRAGDTVLLARPDGFRRELRVRGLRVNGRAADAGAAGSRCAVNLSGIDYGEVERGDWLFLPQAVRATDRLDLRLQLLPDAPRKLAQWSGATLHHAGGQAMARLALLDEALEAGGLAPGGSGLVQAVCDRPLFACCGDRVVIRDAAGRETIGGGRVLDPFPPARHRRRPERLAMLALLAAPDPATRLAALVEHAPLGVDPAELALAHDLPGGRIQALVPDARHLATRSGGRIFSVAAWTALGETVLTRLAVHHADFADEPGVERERLRRMCAPQLPPDVFLARLEALLDEGRVARAGSSWHLPSHTVELTPADRRRADLLVEHLLAGSFDPPWVRELAARCDLDEAATRSLLRRMAMRGEIFQVVRDLFYPRPTVARLSAIATELAEANDGHVRAADFRDRIGGGRKRAIQILEFFDRVGFTRRVGEGHRLAHVVRGEPPVQGGK
ncbi:selenocysteine-specific translation elongation factor [Thauera phenolivorans]|uniref:selenocysteine-specific translation elongation factor n=1 Tax=Thauera phenolivorans TaxID=1792543 RepID=UPI00083A2BF8|nr:selenocysteine-specific translation elongation factor [Thauera phenolivorans]